MDHPPHLLGHQRKDKSISRVTINGTMMASLFFILTLVWTLGPQKFNTSIITQLVLAIPMLFISSLSYAKVSYREKHHVFDRFAWITTTLGNNFVLNVAGLMAATFSKPIAIIYFSTSFILITIYYIINIYDGLDTAREELLKLLFILIIMVIGGIIPLMILF
ncbi:MAG: hypothetical protein WCG99_03015 [Candidatus Berkelbacteria bacterium]